MVRLPKVVDCGQGKASRYVAGQVTHYGTFSQTYGKYEIRAQFPAVRERGLQSALWLWPVNPTKSGLWPLFREIAIDESSPRYPEPAIPSLPSLQDRKTVV